LMEGSAEEEVETEGPPETAETGERGDHLAGDAEVM
jgi:hypothetical protein